MSTYPQESFLQTSLIPGSLLARRREVVSSQTLQYQLRVLKETGRYDAFKLQWHSSYSDPPDVWPIPNHLFWDSDIGKWIEGACYFLHDHPNADIAAAVAELTQMIRAAQQPDGYLNIHYTVVEPGKRFTNLRDFHELYNAGHLIEAALAHHQLYGTNDLLDPLLKYVDLLSRTFGPNPDQLHGYPGHPEIELALLRLYHRTGNPKHFNLAQFFITERGTQRKQSEGEGAEDQAEHYYRVEARKRGEASHARMAYWGEADALWYYQAHRPIVEQPSIEGHSVRAMYLLAAASDLVRLAPSHNNDNNSPQQLRDAIYQLWTNMVSCKMYITGGIGAIKQWEGFGQDYFLPQGSDEGGCYAETCAAIGVMMLAERILQYDLDRRFSDIMELCLYNAVLTAMSADGTKFTYVNQLASSDRDPSRREEWFTCACCPPNVLRLLGQIGGYVYSCWELQERVNVHLYVPSELKFASGGGRSAVLVQKSNWPWSGRVEFELRGDDDLRVSVALRIPEWARSWNISPALPSAGATLEKGYLVLSKEWLSTNRSFTLTIEISTRVVAPHPFTNQDTVALVRGPIVYCAEDFDNPWVKDHFRNVQLDPSCLVEERTVKDDVTGDEYVALTVTKGASMFDAGKIHANPGIDIDPADQAELSDGGSMIDVLNFVPYYFRANRGGRGQSRVGLRRWHRQQTRSDVSSTDSPR